LDLRARKWQEAGEVCKLRMFTKYYWRDQVKENETGGACSTNGGDDKNIYKILVGKPEGVIPRGRSRHRWKDNIRINFRKVGCKG
jgi:hypothetical protein